MRVLTGKHDSPVLLLHGGAGPADPQGSDSIRVQKATESLIHIGRAALAQKPNPVPMDLVVEALKGMENDEQFNAGYGSALQSDGVPRLTAALMNGDSQSFSGVISICNVKNPSVIARHLQNEGSRVVTAPGHEWLARTLGLPVEPLISPRRLEKWYERAVKNIRDTSGDTVGSIYIAKDLSMAAGTSTGGRGFEMPGRVSDSATVAGNYASRFAAVSATGVGEEIVDDALSAKIEVRCRDGMSLKKACEVTFEEAIQLKRHYGWIALSREEWAVCYTTGAMTYAVLSAKGDVIASS